MKRDPRQYRWLEYQGRRFVMDVKSGRDEYEVELSKGEKIGIKKHRGFVYLIDASDLTVQFRLEPKDAKRIIENSKGYSGKISRYKVMPLEGGKDTPNRPKNGILTLTADSSAFRTLKYHKDKKELYIEFNSGAVWAYENVTLREARGLEHAASQGRWFVRKIRNMKVDRPLDAMP